MKKLTFLILGIAIGIIFGWFLGQGTTHAPTTQIALSEGASKVIEIQDTISEKVKNILDDAEVQETLERIERESPKYRQDGAVFMNRERRLPIEPDREYYTEWTVETPGFDDRGHRRIVEGKGGEIYFTDDHYRSFTRVR